MGEGQTERIKEPLRGGYLHGIVEEAPIDQGVKAINDWLRAKIADAVIQEVEERKTFVPSTEHLDPVTRSIVEQHSMRQKRHVPKLLDKYTLYNGLIHEAKTDPDWKKGPHPMPTLAQLAERKKTLRWALDILDLTREADVIDYLFDQAAAIQAPGPRL